jgi:tetratricopeptide (TPR) repeat protein
VKRKKDALFFDVSDENSTKKLEDFDILMDKYQGDSIAKRALYEKAKLLLQMKRYQDVLEMKADILSLDPALYKDTDVIVENAALGLMKKSLKNGECVKVVELSKNYDINLSVEWDAKLYDCYIDAGDFDKAKEIAQTHINTKVFSERVEWLEKYTKIDFELGNYTEVVDAAKELISLRDDKKKNIQTYRLLFDASQRLGDSENMLSSIQKIEELVALKYEDIERYTQMLTYAKNIKDDMMVRNYANKIMQLQKKANSYTQSPYVEFILAQVLMNDNKNAKALEVLSSLDKRDITKDKRSRQKYLMGVLYQKLGDIQKSKESFNRSIEADANSSWAKLAKDALKLL